MANAVAQGAQDAPDTGPTADMNEGAALIEELRSPEPEPEPKAAEPEPALVDELPEEEDAEEEAEAEGDEGDLDTEDGDSEDEEVEAAEETPVPTKKERPSRTERLQRKIGAVSQENDQLREKTYEWAEVANGLKLEKDHYQAYAERLLAQLAEYGGVDDTRGEMERQRLKLELKERDFADQMRAARQTAKQEAEKKLGAERKVDAAMHEGERLEAKYGVDRDFLLFQWMNHDVNSPMEEMAKKLSAKSTVKRSAAVKSQIEKNESAPRRLPRGKSARPTKAPKMGNQESWVDAAYADLIKRRGK